MNQETFHKILSAMMERHVSDVHLQVGYPPLFRLHGELVEVKYKALEPKETIEIATLIVAQRGLEVDFTKFEEIDTSYGAPNIGRFRANIFKQRGTVSIVMRAIPIKIRSFDELNLPPVLKSISNLRRGLVLITGATGMGKSTTLAAVIDHINKHRRAHILTIEDPIEFLFQHEMSVISQREIGYDTKDFSVAVRASLRQDPDVVMVGEMRDSTTADSVLRAAETGHLVLSTLHTPDVMKTINRFLGFFPVEEREGVRVRLADNLMAVVSLRLLMAKSGTGLLPAVEVLRTNKTVQEHIKDPEKIKLLHDYMAKSTELGMQTFDQHLLQLYKEDKVALPIAKAHATSPEQFERMVMVE
jgi:twitching motility protein PilT